jgi:hypothetical protein
MPQLCLFAVHSALLSCATEKALFLKSVKESLIEEIE